MWSSVAIAPYVGLYGDYYFNSDSAAVPAASLATVSAAILDGWSARAAGGANLEVCQRCADLRRRGARWNRQAASGAALWTYRARASVPVLRFAAVCNVTPSLAIALRLTGAIWIFGIIAMLMPEADTRIVVAAFVVGLVTAIIEWIVAGTGVPMDFSRREG